MGNFLSNQDERCCTISTATGLLMRTEITVTPDGDAKVTGVSWSGATIDTDGRQRLYPIQSLLDGATAPELTLTATRVQGRWTTWRRSWEPATTTRRRPRRTARS